MMSSNTHELARLIHALLFSEGGALTFRRIARDLNTDEKNVRTALEQLSIVLQDTGVTLVVSDTEAALVIAEKERPAMTRVVGEDEKRSIGDASLEILAILLYEGPSTRTDIDYIRGVNSSSTIRTLLSRGLIERTGNPEDGREFIYRPTTELLAYLGADRKENLPDYGIIAPELAAFKAGNHAAGDN